jgi:hypothetical protein
MQKLDAGARATQANAFGCRRLVLRSEEMSRRLSTQQARQPAPRRLYLFPK